MSAKANMYTIVSRIGYLIGVDSQIFTNEGDGLQQEEYRYMETVPNAQKIRALCILRCCFLKDLKEIDSEITFGLKKLSDIKYIDRDALAFVETNGLKVQAANVKAWAYLNMINNHIRDNITNVVKQSFPLWIDRGFIKDLFLMKTPSEAKARAAARDYSCHRVRYPWQMYMNMSIGIDDGNMLFNDEKFVVALYAQHGQEFSDRSKVTGISGQGAQDIQEFLDEAEGKVYITVDCENTDVYKLYSMLEWLRGHDAGYEKISQIILYDDIHTTNAWKLLHKFADIKVSHILVERVKEDKSLVDIQLSAGICKAHYKEGINDFLIVSSDSDYFGVINSLSDTDCRFLMAVEKESVSRSTLDAMDEAGIGYCHLDDFCTGSLEPLYAEALKLGVRESLSQKTSVDVAELFEKAAHDARIPMEAGELESYKERYMKDIRLEKDGGLFKMTI